MSLSPQELESKAQMLVNDPTYVIPPQVGIVDRARIEGRASVIRNQNNAIARFNHVAPGQVSETLETSTLGGKMKKNKSKRIKRKQSKKNKRKSKR